MWEIVGDTKDGKHKGSMIWVAGNSKEQAEETLARIKANPDKYEKQRLEEHENIRVEKDKDPWYLDSRNFRD